MSSRNSALASLTANYTDSEDEEHSPVPLSHIEASREESRSGVSQDESGTSTDGILSGQSRGGDSGTRNALDLIDDDAIDDFPIGVEREFGTAKEEGDILEHGDGDAGKSPAERQSPHEQQLETVSSDDEMSSTSTKRVKLPPAPPGKCSAKLQEKFTTMYEQTKRGQLNMNEVIQTRKMFRNPSIYEKLISHLEIDEFGTNYPEHMFNPHEWKEGSFYDELAKVQKTEMDRREKERRDRTKVEFVSGTAKKTIPTPTPSGTGSSQPEAEAKRKSKWDQRGVMPPLLMTVGSTHSAAANVPPNPANANSLNSAALVKPKTVTISAFGSLPKKK